MTIMFQIKVSSLRVLIIIGALSLLSGCTVSKLPVTKQQVPSTFIDKERFYIKLPTVTGDTLSGFADTGGGFTAVYSHVLKRLQLTDKIKTQTEGGNQYQYILYNDVVSGSPVSSIGFNPSSGLKEPVFNIPSEEEMQGDISFLIEVLPHDAFLGQFFFAGKSWTFDYLNQSIYINTPIHQSELKKKHVQQLGFKKNEKGEKLFAHPRMQIKVDDEIIDVLFDTGASIILSKKGKEKLGTAKHTIGGSFIARSVYENWKQKHPEWKVIEKGDFNSDLIEVPELTIGGYVVGPVLFSVRPDEAWSKGMIHSMDKVVKGAIGGSALKYLIVTIDYNSELIKFSK